MWFLRIEDSNCNATPSRLPLFAFGGGERAEAEGVSLDEISGNETMEENRRMVVDLVPSKEKKNRFLNE